MKLGTLAYRTPTGLGYQAKSYIKHLPVVKTMVINLQPLNGMPTNQWYANEPTVDGYPKENDIVSFLEGLDAVLLAETPLNYALYDIARKKGVKTVVVANWEFFDHLNKPDLPLPDAIIMPSVWRLDEALDFGAKNGVEIYQIHHPVDRDEFAFRLRTTNKDFHIAGNPAVYDRNGTMDYLNANPNGVVITQNNRFADRIRQRYGQCRVVLGVENPVEVYNYGDILVLPRRYGGNCLPLNEALSSGCPVIMTDISPNNHLLPKEWLVPADLAGSFEPRTKVDIYSVQPAVLKYKIDWLKTLDIKELSQQADKIADTISWDNLKDKYIKALQ